MEPYPRAKHWSKTLTCIIFLIFMTTLGDKQLIFFPTLQVRKQRDGDSKSLPEISGIGK